MNESKTVKEGIESLPWKSILPSILSQLHWNERQLGDFLGVSRQAVSQYESGETCPKLETALKILKLYFDLKGSGEEKPDFLYAQGLNETEIRHLNDLLGDLRKHLLHIQELEQKAASLEEENLRLRLALIDKRGS